MNTIKVRPFVLDKTQADVYLDRGGDDVRRLGSIRVHLGRWYTRLARQDNPAHDNPRDAWFATMAGALKHLYDPDKNPGNRVLTPEELNAHYEDIAYAQQNAASSVSLRGLYRSRIAARVDEAERHTHGR